MVRTEDVAAVAAVVAAGEEVEGGAALGESQLGDCLSACEESGC